MWEVKISFIGNLVEVAILAAMGQYTFLCSFLFWIFFRCCCGFCIPLFLKKILYYFIFSYFFFLILFFIFSFYFSWLAVMGHRTSLISKKIWFTFWYNIFLVDSTKTSSQTVERIKVIQEVVLLEVSKVNEPVINKKQDELQFPPEKMLYWKRKRDPSKQVQEILFLSPFF